MAYAYAAPTSAVYVQPTEYVAVNPPAVALTPATNVVVTEGGSYWSESGYWIGVFFAVLLAIGLIGVIIWSVGVWFNSPNIDSSSSSSSTGATGCVVCPPSPYPTSSTSSCGCAPNCCRPLGCAAPNCANGRLAWRRPPFSS